MITLALWLHFAHDVSLLLLAVLGGLAWVPIEALGSYYFWRRGHVRPADEERGRE